MTHKQKLKQALQELDALKEKVKVLIEPELEVGKWYHFNGSLLCYQGRDERGYVQAYGFAQGMWHDKGDCGRLPRRLNESTSKEVEQALIKEAKRRYVYVQCISNDLNTENNEKYDYNFDDFFYCKHLNTLYAAPEGQGVLVVFSNGKWASILEHYEDKFIRELEEFNDSLCNFDELKGAHRNGAVIQYKSKIDGLWGDCGDIIYWRSDYEYRIKPEKSCPLNDDIQSLRDKHPEYNFTIIVDKK